MQERPIYTLVRSRPEASLLPALKRSPTDCAALTAAARSGTPLPPSNRILCGVQRRPGGVSVGGMTMGQIAAELLTPEAGRLVLEHSSETESALESEHNDSVECTNRIRQLRIDVWIPALPLRVQEAIQSRSSVRMKLGTFQSTHRCSRGTSMLIHA